MIRTVVCLLLLLVYGMLFLQNEQAYQSRKAHLTETLPVPIMQIALGYLKQLGSEMLFVKSAVFLGGHNTPKDIVYADALAQNFDVSTELYPEFIDNYYLIQSSLSYINPEYAGKANDLLAKGVATRPDDLILPFFRGFNYFHYMDDNARAAEVFFELSQRPKAPSWLGHLSAVLSAKNGDLYAGLLSLQVLHAAEEDEYVKARYASDIKMFENAIVVYEATQAFLRKHGQSPQTLDALIPEFLPEIPETSEGFELLWSPPRLKLVRPEKS